jgi:hypothetical protein
MRSSSFSSTSRHTPAPHEGSTPTKSRPPYSQSGPDRPNRPSHRDLGRVRPRRTRRAAWRFGSANTHLPRAGKPPGPSGWITRMPTATTSRRRTGPAQRSKPAARPPERPHKHGHHAYVVGAGAPAPICCVVQVARALRRERTQIDGNGAGSRGRQQAVGRSSCPVLIWLRSTGGRLRGRGSPSHPRVDPVPGISVSGGPSTVDVTDLAVELGAHSLDSH